MAAPASDGAATTLVTNLLRRRWTLASHGLSRPPTVPRLYRVNRIKNSLSSAFLVCFLLVLMTLAAFWPVRHCEFVAYDDQEYVTENPHVRDGLTREGIAWAFRSAQFANWHPLTWLSHMLDCQLYGLKPQGHHVTNLILHLANTLLLFLVLRRTTGAVWRSAFVAALFALHPLRVESVAWVAERKDVLSTLFFMLTLWAHVKHVSGVRVQGSGPECGFVSRVTRHLSRYYWLALFFFALGLMSKPMLVTMPFVLLLLDYWPLQRLQFASRWTSSNRQSAIGNPQSSSPRRLSPVTCHLSLLLEKLPFFLLSAGFSAVAFLAQRSAGAVAPTSGFPLHLRVANALVSYCRYLGKTFWPDNLAVFYPHPGTWPLWQVIAAGTFLAMVSVLVLRSAQQRPYLLVGWYWFVGMLIPVIGLVQVGMQSMADRYTYLPLIGVFIMVSWFAADWTALTPRRTWAVWPIAIGLLLACSGLTQRQVLHWQNTERLFEHALRATRNNDVAHNGLGVIRYRQKKTGEAIAHLKDAVRLRPGYAEAHNNLGGILVEQGRIDDGITHLSRALEINPDYASAHNNLGLALTKLGKTAEAATHFAVALKLQPNQSDAHNNLGSAAFDEGRLDDALAHFRLAVQGGPESFEARLNLAMTLAALGRTDEAIAECEAALRLKPDSPVAHNKLGNILLAQGKLEAAGWHFRAALQAKPDYADAHNNLGLMLARQNKLNEAIAQYRQALRCDSNHVVAHNNLGLALAGQGHLEEAVKHFGEVVRLKPGQAQAHNDLAIALARQGKFADALAHFNLALKHGADPAQAQNNMGMTCSALGKIEAAIEHYQEAIRLRPDAVEPLNNLAWLLATQPEARYRNGSEAVALAERAVELTKRQHAGKLDTLAAAYAEAGRFSEAEKTALQAMAVARAAEENDLAPQIETRLKGYQNRRPWHEP